MPDNNKKMMYVAPYLQQLWNDALEEAKRDGFGISFILLDAFAKTRKKPRPIYTDYRRKENKK